MRDTSSPNYEECLNRVIEFVKKPEVAGFYIGMTGPDLRGRLHGYDHYYAGRRQGWIISAGLDEKGALDLEEYLCLAARGRKYRATAFYIKYDEKEAPANIVAFTFTDKAAAELKERIHNRCLRIWVITLSGLRRRVRFVGWQFSSMLPLETKDGEHVGGGIQGSVSSR